MKIPLFDIDGTLFKTGGKLHADAFRHAFKTVYGVNATKDDAEWTEGKVDNEIIIDVMKFHGLQEEKIKKNIKTATNAMSHYFKTHQNSANPQLLPGVSAILLELKATNIPMGVLTGNVEEIGWIKLEKAGFKGFFGFGAFGDSVFKRVDLVEIARENAQKTLGRTVSKDELVIVGDTPKDVQCARDAGIEVILVSTGLFTFEKLKKQKPDLLVHDFQTEGEKVIEFIKN